MKMKEKHTLTSWCKYHGQAIWTIEDRKEHQMSCCEVIKVDMGQSSLSAKNIFHELLNKAFSVVNDDEIRRVAHREFTGKLDDLKAASGKALKSAECITRVTRSHEALLEAAKEALACGLLPVFVFDQLDKAIALAESL